MMTCNTSVVMLMISTLLSLVVLLQWFHLSSTVTLRTPVRSLQRGLFHDRKENYKLYSSLSKGLPSWIKRNPFSVQRQESTSLMLADRVLPKVSIGTIYRVYQIMRQIQSSSKTVPSRNVSSVVRSLSRTAVQIMALATVDKILGLESGNVLNGSNFKSALILPHLYQIPLDMLLIGGQNNGENALLSYRKLSAGKLASDLSGFAHIVIERLFNEGDMVTVNFGTEYITGIVHHIGIRVTQIRSSPNTVHYIPNHKFTQSNIRVSHVPFCRRLGATSAVVPFINDHDLASFC